MSACAECAGWHGPILFENLLSPLFTEHGANIFDQRIALADLIRGLWADAFDPLFRERGLYVLSIVCYPWVYNDHVSNLPPNGDMALFQEIVTTVSGDWALLVLKGELDILNIMLQSYTSPGWLSGERVGLMNWWLWVRDPVEANFFPAYFFRLSPLLKHVRKVVGGFGKKKSVRTGVRKPGNTCASPTAMIWPQLLKWRWRWLFRFFKSHRIKKYIYINEIYMKNQHKSSITKNH